MQVTWDIRTPEPHSVRVEDSSWTGEVELSVDGRTILKRVWLLSGEHSFQVDGAPCVLRVKSGMFTNGYELWVNGKQI